jgi:sulfite exporter TauE/SafE
MIGSAEALTALGIGLAGAGHCLGMCGGIAAAINLGGYRGPGATLAYHAGRLASYSLLGALLAGLAGSVNLAQWTMGLRYLAGLLLIAMGLSIGNWWQGVRQLERAGALLWQPVQRASRSLLPIRHGWQAALLGLGWGLMPCGLIYSALAWSATTQSAGSGALLMLLFGIGTLPAMLTTSFGAGGAEALLRRQGLRRAIAVFLILSGAWSLLTTSRHGGHLDKPVGADTPHTAPHTAPMHSGHSSAH